jgi:hypothetical protein
MVSLGGRFEHPAILVDPRPETLAVVRSLRARGVPIVLLTARRLEPATYVRGVRRERLPNLATHPGRWEARLLELAAQLEPRPLVLGCSAPALEFLERTRARLGPHFVHGNWQLPLAPCAERIDPEIALRRAMSRGEAALEVQLTLETNARRTGACVLAWTPGAAPDLLVASIAGDEVIAHSETFLRQHVGYARLIWAPDRFGRLALHGASTLPGPGLELALQDGVDFATLGYAAALGHAMPAQPARRQLVRRLSLLEPGLAGEASPLVEMSHRLHCKDPIPWIAALLRGLVRT